MRQFLTAVALLAAAVVPAKAADQSRVEAIVTERCSLCHGMKGDSVSAVFPRLAGQHWEYVAKQLAEFKSGKRKSETMQPQAENLTPAEMQALGKYFESKQVPGRQIRDAELLGVGKYIFQRGNLFSGLPACASCHGDNGHGTAQLPRLAGQHPRYTEEQIKQFNTRERNNDNAVMHTVASKLTELETHAVAAYIATLD